MAKTQHDWAGEITIGLCAAFTLFWSICLLADAGGGYYVKPFWAAVWYTAILGTLLLVWFVGGLVRWWIGGRSTMTDTQRNTILTSFCAFWILYVITVAQLWAWYEQHKTPGVAKGNDVLPVDQSISAFFSFQKIEAVSVIGSIITYFTVFPAIGSLREPLFQTGKAKAK
jgi:hypothetical protein